MRKKPHHKNMKGYATAAVLWKHESFRTFVAIKKHTHDVDTLDAEILRLTIQKERLLKSGAPTWTREHGNTRQGLCKLLPWSDIRPIVKEYRRTHPPPKRGRFKAIVQFFEEMLG